MGTWRLMSAIAGGAEAVLVPEFKPQPEEIMRAFKEAWKQGKPHFIVVAAEGAALSAEELHEYVNDAGEGFDSRLTVLGHVQRGGNPTAYDRILASRMGTAAVKALFDGETAVMVGLHGSQVGRVPLDKVIGRSRPIDQEIYEIAQLLGGWPEETSY